VLLVASASGRACWKWGVGAVWLSLLPASAAGGVVVAGPTVAVCGGFWGYFRRGISPTLGDSAYAAVRGCVLGYSQWGITLPLAAYSGTPAVVLGRATLPLPRPAELALRHPPRTGLGIWRRGAGVVRSGGLLGVKIQCINQCHRDLPRCAQSFSKMPRPVSPPGSQNHKAKAQSAPGKKASRAPPQAGHR
jgi:hypothetical protein